MPTVIQGRSFIQKPIALCALFVAALASRTRADFHVSGYGYPGPVDDVYEFYALDDGINGTGTRAASVDVHLTNINEVTAQLGQGFVVKQGVVGPYGAMDLTGYSLYYEHGNSPAVLFSGHSDRTFVNLLGDEATANPTLFDATLIDPPDFLIHYNQVVYQFEIAGNVAGGMDASADVNNARGALIAVAVVQHGDPVVATGLLGAANGESSAFTVQNPEPSSVILTGLATGTMLLRSQRKHS